MRNIITLHGHQCIAPNFCDIHDPVVELVFTKITCAKKYIAWSSFHNNHKNFEPRVYAIIIIMIIMLKMETIGYFEGLGDKLHVHV